MDLNGLANFGYLTLGMNTTRVLLNRTIPSLPFNTLSGTSQHILPNHMPELFKEQSLQTIISHKGLVRVHLT